MEANINFHYVGKITARRSGPALTICWNGKPWPMCERVCFFDVDDAGRMARRINGDVDAMLAALVAAYDAKDARGVLAAITAAKAYLPATVEPVRDAAE